MSKDLMITELEKNFLTVSADKPEYKVMATNIKEKMPAVQKASSNFYKSHSQFMNVMLDVTAITPIRSIKHSLAEVEKTRSALQDAYFSVEKNKIEIKIKARELDNCEDELDAELLQLELNEKQAGLVTSENHMQAALRKMNFFVNQYESIMEKLGKSEITEEEYEQEECRYHIMTCMKQGLNAARSHGGIIDEGNLIYLFDLGVNAAQAQAEVFAYLQMENEMIEEGKAPTHQMTMKWLEACADKWADDPKIFADYRGFNIMDRQSLTNVPLLEEDKE
jgi:hypothetical protein